MQVEPIAKYETLYKLPEDSFFKHGPERVNLTRIDSDYVVSYWREAHCGTWFEVYSQLYQKSNIHHFFVQKRNMLRDQINSRVDRPACFS